MHTLGAPKDTLLKDTFNVLGSQTVQRHAKEIDVCPDKSGYSVVCPLQQQQGRQGLCQLHLVTTGTGPQPRRHGAQ